MKIGIIGAMDVEVRHLRDAVQDGTTTTVAGMVFDDGTIGGTPVTVVRCGVGKVDAAMCAQVLTTALAWTASSTPAWRVRLMHASTSATCS